MSSSPPPIPVSPSVLRRPLSPTSTAPSAKRQRENPTPHASPSPSSSPPPSPSRTLSSPPPSVISALLSSASVPPFKSPSPSKSIPPTSQPSLPPTSQPSLPPTTVPTEPVATHPPSNLSPASPSALTKQSAIPVLAPPLPQTSSPVQPPSVKPQSMEHPSLLPNLQPSLRPPLVPPRPPTRDRRRHEKPPQTQKETRRIWNRLALKKSGLSPPVLKAFDAFTKNAPPIPTHPVTHSKRTPVRDMRSWIAKLEHADTQPVWDALISVLRCDTSAFQTWGSKWDHDFCRFSLGVLVSDSSQTRQAVNNAIKRELTCPIESGASSRGKTFRDLFREKCRQGSVQLPPLDHASTSRPSSNNSSIHPSFPPLSQHPLTVSPPSLPISSCFISSKLPQFPLHTTSLSSVGSHDQNQPGKSYISSQRSLSLDGNHLSNLKGQCGRDEWGRTAWWELPSDYDVQLLPPLLLQFQLFDLRTLLLDFRWVMRTFRCLDFSRGMRQIPTEGYDFLLNHAKVSALPLPPAEIESFRLIKNAMMLIMPILWNQYSDKPKDHGFIAILATQLVGRLLDLKRRFAAIALFIDSIKTHTPRPWLLPLTRCLQEPRMDIKLAVPSNGVFTPHLIALSEDGSLLVTSGAYVEVSSEVKSDIKSETKQDSSYTETFQAKRDRRKNGSILIWDVESGKQCDCTKTSNFVRHLTIARDNGCIIAETVDGLYFWELCKDGDKWSISAPIEASQSQRLKSLSSITAAKTRLVLTTHRIPSQPTIALWNTRDGERKKIFEAVKSNANCLDVSRSGDFFASGHDNGYIHLWNISENEPVLSFSNEGNGNGQQQVEALEEVNNHALEYFRYSSSRRTVSISFLEKGEDRWLAAVSQNHVIRIWRLPPRTISKDQWKTFVSSLRTAVIRCPLVQDVQWCDNGKFFTGGDDGVARMWELSKTRTWMWFDIGKEGKRESSNLSTVLVSCGKHSRFVATYVTKSPYVTVWDMSNSGSDAEPWREPLYRSYFPMVRNSVDARDMGHLSTHQHMNDEMMKCVMDSNTDASQKTLDTGELQLFQNHDNPNCTSIEGDMQPWLRMKLETWKDELRVCFEQPVRSGASGKFLGLKLEPRKGEPTQYLMGNSTVNNTDVAQHHGMVATLQDMTTGIFQVQDVEGEGGKKDDQDVSDVRSGSTVIREKDNMGEGDDMYALSAGVEAKI